MKLRKKWKRIIVLVAMFAYFVIDVSFVVPMNGRLFAILLLMFLILVAIFERSNFEE